jgi:hypothetical protein
MVIWGICLALSQGGAIRQAGHQEPLQGVFLAIRDTHRSYRSEKRSYICTRLPMCAEGVAEIDCAAQWISRAVSYARQYPGAWADVLQYTL